MLKHLSLEIDHGTPARASVDTVTLSIDGFGVTVPKGTSLMRAAVDAGIQVPKLCAEAVNEIMRACAAGGVYKTNSIERVFRDLHVARGHIANNTDTYARSHGAVMLGLPNADAFV